MTYTIRSHLLSSYYKLRTHLLSTSFTDYLFQFCRFIFRSRPSPMYHKLKRSLQTLPLYYYLRTYLSLLLGPNSGPREVTIKHSFPLSLCTSFHSLQWSLYPPLSSLTPQGLRITSSTRSFSSLVLGVRNLTGSVYRKLSGGDYDRHEPRSRVYTRGVHRFMNL